MKAKPLDRWARDCAGCNDFDTYIRIGGSSAEARRDIRNRIAALQLALLDLVEPSRDEPHRTVRPTPVADPNLASLKTEDEPVDLGNAHVQGADEA